MTRRSFYGFATAAASVRGASSYDVRDTDHFDPFEKLDFTSSLDRETAYFHYGLIAGENVHDVAIEGRGAIDGNGAKRGGPNTVAMKLCERVSIRGVRVRNAPGRHHDPQWVRRWD